jgi:hypothetical protein
VKLTTSHSSGAEKMDGAGRPITKRAACLSSHKGAYQCTAKPLHTVVIDISHGQPSVQFKQY